VIERVSGEWFFARAFGSSLPFVRCAVVVSSKVAPRAVDRVRIRRDIYQLIPPSIFQKATGKDVVITITKNVDIKKTEGIGEEFSHAIKKII